MFLCCKIFEMVKVKSSTLLAELSNTASTLYESFVWQTVTSLGLFTWHFYVRMYSMPTATLNKKSNLNFYLGDVQIISFT